MDNKLPELDSDVLKIASQLGEIAQEEGIDVVDLIRILVALPIGDSEERTYLEDADRCILEMSSLVDKSFPNLPQNQKVAKKFKLMSKLLSLKAEVLV